MLDTADNKVQMTYPFNVMIDERGICKPTITELRKSIDSLTNFALVTGNSDLRTITSTASIEIESKIAGSAKEIRLTSFCSNNYVNSYSFPNGKRTIIY